LITGVWRIHQNVTFALNHPGQVGVAHALTMNGSYYEELQAMYTAKRDLLLSGLQQAGLKALAPEGAFYIMADFSEVFAGDDVAFTKHLIRDIGVACIPPSAFFSEPNKAIMRQYVRFTYCKTDDILQQAIQNMLKLRG
jgi:aspartate/methionine/tyrosine aminotransferase